MLLWEKLFLVVVGVYSFVGFGLGLIKSRKGNAYGFCYAYYIVGAFVWADAIVFGLFWTLTSLALLILNSWVLTELTFSIFWVVRSLGETIYWFLQQFSTVNRNPPERLHMYHIFKNDAMWFVIQIFWQCITVISILFSLYFGTLWIQTLH